MIYAPPSEVKRPNFSTFMTKDGFDNNAYREAEDQYVKDIREIIGESFSGKYVGKIAKFPIADGYAEYMICSLRPLAVIHLELGDCYSYPYAHRLNSKDFKENVDGQEAMKRIFSKV